MSESTEIQRSLRLGDILIERGVISEVQLSSSLQYQKETGARLGEALAHLGYVTPEQIADALAWQGAHGLSALTEIVPNPSAVVLLTEKFCRARQVLPIDFHKNRALVLAMVNPADVLTIDDVRLITGLEVIPVVATLGVLSEAWEAVYSRRGRLESAPLSEDEHTGPSDQELAE